MGVYRYVVALKMTATMFTLLLTLTGCDDGECSFLEALTGCVEHECSDLGVWCDGDIYYHCFNDGSHIGNDNEPNELNTVDCAEYGATCIEEIWEGSDIHYCGYPERKCPESSDSELCIGDFIGFCDSWGTFPMVAGGFEAPSLECVDNNWPCVEIVHDDESTSAVCTYITEPCEQDADSFCDEGEFGSAVVRCENSIWIPYQCDGGETCCETAEGIFNCVDNWNAEDACID